MDGKIVITGYYVSEGKTKNGVNGLSISLKKDTIAKLREKLAENFKSTDEKFIPSWFNTDTTFMNLYSKFPIQHQSEERLIKGDTVKVYVTIVGDRIFPNAIDFVKHAINVADFEEV